MLELLVVVLLIFCAEALGGLLALSVQQALVCAGAGLLLFFLAKHLRKDG